MYLRSSTRTKNGKAHTYWALGKIEMRRMAFRKAFEHLSVSYALNLKLNRLEDMSWVGLDLGKILCLFGQTEAGIDRLILSRDGFMKLGREDLAQMTDAIISECGGF